LERFGIWDQVRVDGGKEFRLICHIQEHLQNFRMNLARKPYHQSKSTDVSELRFLFKKKSNNELGHERNLHV